MSDFLSLAKARYSVRSFKPDAIAPEKLARILEAGQVAPTACNSQAVHIYVLESEKALAEVGLVTKYTFGAPTILMVCYDTEHTWKNPLEAGITSGEEDAAIVGTHMMFQAWEEGVGSCWVGYFPNSQLAEKLGLPKNHMPVFLMPIGYPADDAKPAPLHTKYKSLDELVTTL